MGVQAARHKARVVWSSISIQKGTTLWLSIRCGGEIRRVLTPIRLSKRSLPTALNAINRKAPLERNWGYSPASKGQFEVAARNINNISALIAERHGEVVGFTMFAPALNQQGLYGRAFFTGVAPAYQRKGLSVALTLKLSAIALSVVGRGRISVSWMLEDNIMVLRTMRHLTQEGVCHERAYRIYRYATPAE